MNFLNTISYIFLINFIYILQLSNQQNYNSFSTVSGDTSKYINFQIKVLNNTFNVRVHLSIQLENHNFNKTSLTSSTTTTTTPTSKPYVRQYRSYDEIEKHFTIDDAIEAFRKDLIEKETNIGGIIESSNVFFRHFNLKYDNCEIRIRCSYYSNFSYRKLNIYCFEYDTEIKKDLVYLNAYRRMDEQIARERKVGEIETSPLFERSRNSINIRTINVNDYLQTLHMSIQ